MAETEHHLLITGTGRAGTSFLVKYLAELGLDTHLEDPDGASWDEVAHAGLEDLLLLEQPKHLPYVIKSPWLTEYIDQVLARDDIAIDGVIIPVRNILSKLRPAERSLRCNSVMRAFQVWLSSKGVGKVGA